MHPYPGTLPPPSPAQVLYPRAFRLQGEKKKKRRKKKEGGGGTEDMRSNRGQVSRRRVKSRVGGPPTPLASSYLGNAHQRVLAGWRSRGRNTPTNTLIGFGAVLCSRPGSRTAGPCLPSQLVCDLPSYLRACHSASTVPYRSHQYLKGVVED
jgi:hypothetical protein